MLGQLADSHDLVLADFEAGLGTVVRLKPGFVDVLLVVAEPTAKAVDVAQRAVATIVERELGRAIVIANRVASDDDRLLLDTAFGASWITVPDDDGVREAGVRGAAPFDTVPDSPVVARMRAVARELHESPDATRPPGQFSTPSNER